ncbi:hypothetical protein F4779DRAFT_569836 [Xylariaceae sp. FL0662B]|nr:hypothetical protein F4779DRAFT_569836 [Xylariaceae sp. FL0662B]
MPLTGQDLLFETFVFGVAGAFLLAFILTSLFVFGAADLHGPEQQYYFLLAIFSCAAAVAIMYGLMFREREWTVLISRLGTVIKQPI